MAARSLGTLTLDLTAKIGGFTGPLDKAERASKKSMKGIQGSAKDTAKAFTALSGVIAGVLTGAFAVWIKSSIDAADAASKAATAAGVSIEAFQGLAFAAKLGGVEQGQFEAALKKLNSTISEAAQGVKTYSEAFAAIGVSVRDSTGQMKTADQVLLDIADRFAGLEDGANKSALAQELFGRAGAKLIPLLNQGREGIQKLTDQAERLGLIMSQEAATAAENFNDSLTVLSSVSRGLANQMAAELLPTLNSLTGLLIDVAEESEGASFAGESLGVVLKAASSVAIDLSTRFNNLARSIAGIGSAIALAASGEFGEATDAIGDFLLENANASLEARERITKLWSGAYEEIGADAAETGAAIRGVLERTTEAETKAAAASVKATETAQDAILKQIETLEQQVATYGLSEAAVIRYRIASGDLAATFAAAGSGAEQYKEQLISLTDRLIELNAEEEAAKIIEEEINAIRDRGIQITQSVITAEEAWIETITELNKLREAGAISQETYNRALEEADKQFEESGLAADDFAQATKKAFETAAQNAQGALADFLFDPFSDGLDGMLNGFVTMLRRMGAELLAAEVFKMLGEGFGGSGAGGSGTVGLIGSLASLFGGGRASGGPVTAGNFFEVGEFNRPELFISGGREYLIPGNDGRVVPMGQDSEARGGNVTQVFNVQTPDANSFRKSRRQIVQEARRGIG